MKCEAHEVYQIGLYKIFNETLDNVFAGMFSAVVMYIISKLHVDSCILHCKIFSFLIVPPCFVSSN